MTKYEKGYKFGNLTFINEDFHEKEVTGFQKYRMAVIECFCGRKFITRISGLKNGRTKSCGCTRRDGLLKRITRHNMSNSSEYSSWESMKSRCQNPNNIFYYNYGGRGIKTCERWNNFKNFYKDMGKKPDKSYSLERIDVNGDYYLENCKWATRKEQDRNKRNTIFLSFNKEKWILVDLAKKFNIHQQTLKSRIDRGMSPEEAIYTPIKYNKK